MPVKSDASPRKSPCRLTVTGTGPGLAQGYISSYDDLNPKTTGKVLSTGLTIFPLSAEPCLAVRRNLSQHIRAERSCYLSATAGTSGALCARTSGTSGALCARKSGASGATAAVECSSVARRARPPLPVLLARSGCPRGERTTPERAQPRGQCVIWTASLQFTVTAEGRSGRPLRAAGRPAAAVRPTVTTRPCSFCFKFCKAST